MQYWAKSSIAVSVLLAGCSMFDSSQVDTAKEQRSLESIKVPAGLHQPAMPGQFDIPATDAPAVDVEIKAPSLVLATASSSRVEEGERLARVWFDRNDFTGDLMPFLQQALTAQFAEKGVTLQQTDEKGLEYTTGWITRSDETGFWFWKSATATEQARFKLLFEPRPHGRSASLTVTMLEHEHFVAESKLAGREAHRQEVALLNQIIDRVGKEEIAIALANKAKAPDVSVEPGLDKDGNAALLSSQSVDVVWSQLEAVFAALNLSVTDMNRSAFTYYLSYQKPTQSFWSSIWGKDAPIQLPLQDGEYQLVLKRNDNGTAIIMQNSSGEALSPETVLTLHEPFVQAVRQARVEL